MPHRLCPPPWPRFALWGVTAAVCSLVATGAASAQSEVRFTFEGRGFGHGVGMSQYGARGAARQGMSASEILAHYYRGTQVTSANPATVRVLTNDGVPALTVRAFGGATTVTSPGSGSQATLARDAEYTARAGLGEVRLEGPGGAVVARSSSRLTINAAPQGLQSGRRRYRGVVDVISTSRGLRVINRVNSEQYLRGVVAKEMPASWGDDTPAALQAQAIAA